jgi:WW domain-binding protein 4
MSEYWVSHKRYHCKYCNIYIADDVPSRQHHENGMRHKGNVERFVRGLYKAGEKAVKDRDEEKREMERISKAAAAAYAQDVGAGLGGVGSSSRDAPTAAPAPKKPPTKPSNPYANYSTAASLGYADPDAERAKAEANIRQTMGVAGEWQFVQHYTSASPALVQSEVPSVSEDANGETGSSVGDRKREAPVDDIEDERVFKLKKKRVNIGLGELHDPGLIPIKLKAKKEESTEPQPASSTTAVDDIKADAQDALPADAKVKIAWKRAAFQPAADEPAPDGVMVDSGGEGAPEAKLEKSGVTKEEVFPVKIEPEPQIPPEPVKKEEVISPSLEAPAPTSLFRKRKLPTRR